MSKTLHTTLHIPHGDFVFGAGSPKWPEKVDALCLHCAEACTNVFPSVRFHDPQQNVFVVYGFFCSPGCALANANDVKGDSSRRLLWTQTVLRRYFGVSPNIRPAPPRAALQKFGGPLTLEQFYGKDAEHTEYVCTVEPPFITSSMITTIERQARGESTSTLLQRPTTRTTPAAQMTDTGEEPMILEFLATGNEPEEPPSKRSKDKPSSENGTLSAFMVKR